MKKQNKTTNTTKTNKQKTTTKSFQSSLSLRKVSILQINDLAWEISEQVNFSWNHINIMAGGGCRRLSPAHNFALLDPFKIPLIP